MIEYTAAASRYRVLAGRRPPRGIYYYPAEGSVCGRDLLTRTVSYDLMVVEQMTDATTPTFHLVDASRWTVTETGCALAEIIATFGDEDAAVMALRMTK